MLRAEFESLLFADWDEGVYAETAVLSQDGAGVLIPVIGAARLSDIWRKVDRAGVAMPRPHRIAVEPDSGQLVRIPPRLELPADAREKLGEIAAGSRRKRKTAPNGEVSRIAAVCLLDTRPVDEPELLKPVSRAVAIKSLAEEHAVNLPAVGVRGLEALVRMTEGVPCYELRHRNADELLEGVVTALSRSPAPTAA
jgi:hypothetical protein